MAKEIILSKESSESEIKAYFNAVLKLSQSDNEFPINFDEVWMLVYEDKKSAIRELKDKFMQDVDFQTVRKKVQASNIAGFVWADDYYLTVSCMEFFIARKVRPVFEVYRKVFHHTVQNGIGNNKKTKREPTLTTKVRVGLEWVKGVSEMLNLNDSSKLSLLGKVAEPLNLPLPDYTPSHGILKSATDLLKERKTQISAREFNTVAIEKGYLCELERKSSYGQKKKFKSITEKGLSFGENQVNPNNPKGTQPLWYESKFDELLAVLGFHFIGETN